MFKRNSICHQVVDAIYNVTSSCNLSVIFKNVYIYILCCLLEFTKIIRYVICDKTFQIKKTAEIGRIPDLLRKWFGFSAFQHFYFIFKTNFVFVVVVVVIVVANISNWNKKYFNRPLLMPLQAKSKPLKQPLVRNCKRSLRITIVGLWNKNSMYTFIF